MVYVRDGIRCFVSETLRRELFITDGMLVKEPKKRAKMFGCKYYSVFCAIDFSRKLVRFKRSGLTREDLEGFAEEKDIPFAAVLEVRNLQLDVFTHEYKDLTELKFTGKLLLRTM